MVYKKQSQNLNTCASFFKLKKTFKLYTILVEIQSCYKVDFLFCQESIQSCAPDSAVYRVYNIAAAYINFKGNVTDKSWCID